MKYVYNILYVAAVLLTTAEFASSSALAQEDGQKVIDAFRNLFEVSKEAGLNASRGIVADSILNHSNPPSSLQDAEEIGYREYFVDLDRLAFVNSFKAISGEPSERTEAKEALSKAYSNWHPLLSRTLPPDTMKPEALDVHRRLLRLLERSKQASTPEEITDSCVGYLRTRADYNSSIRERTPAEGGGKDNRETRFTFRPGGNAVGIVGGSLSDLQFRISIAVPTPAGGIVVWRQEKPENFKYLIVQYKDQLRFFRLGTNCDFVLEDSSMYKVAAKPQGDCLLLTISTRETASKKQE